MESMEREIYILYYAVPDKIIFCKGFQGRVQDF